MNLKYLDNLEILIDKGSWYQKVIFDTKGRKCILSKGYTASCSKGVGKAIDHSFATLGAPNMTQTGEDIQKDLNFNISVVKEDLKDSKITSPEVEILDGMLPQENHENLLSNVEDMRMKMQENLDAQIRLTLISKLYPGQKDTNHQMFNNGDKSLVGLESLVGNIEAQLMETEADKLVLLREYFGDDFLEKIWC